MKKIVVFADGTWNSPEEGRPTHVLQMAQAACQPDQVVFYDWGVGTEGQRIAGGVSGAGIDKNIMDCYRFVVHNYEPGDLLHFFGFSRGAYTVRSLAGFIRNCGLLRREHADRIAEAYALYRSRTRTKAPWGPRAQSFRERYAVADLTPIEFVGVFDTVGTLGIPVPFWGTLGEREFLFHDTEPSRIIRHARHALAIDEEREDFLPTLWNDKPGLDLQQVWFAGVHADVGGGYAEPGLGHVAIRWMADEAATCGLHFERHLLETLVPDPFAPLHESRSGIYRLRGEEVRALSGPVHRSVRDRWEADTDGYRTRSRALARLLQSVDGDWSRIDCIG